jgi:hypothetical protein
MFVPLDCQELGRRLDRDAGHTLVYGTVVGEHVGGLRLTHPKGGKACLDYDRHREQQ